MDYIIEMLNITKEFPGIIANDDITLQVKKGEIHALLGENGAGKSTLMSVLFGLYQPERGIIKIKGQNLINSLQKFSGIKPKLFIKNKEPTPIKSSDPIIFLFSEEFINLYF